MTAVFSGFKKCGVLKSEKWGMENEDCGSRKCGCASMVNEDCG